MSECGYTPDYIDLHMDIPRLAALNKFWQVCPPLTISIAGIAAALGVKMPEPRKPDELLSKARAEAAVFNRGSHG